MKVRSEQRISKKTTGKEQKTQKKVKWETINQSKTKDMIENRAMKLA